MKLTSPTDLRWGSIGNNAHPEDSMLGPRRIAATDAIEARDMKEAL